MSEESKSVSSTLVVSNLILCFCSFFSDPLYLSYFYFIFLSPYLLKLASFLSPLLFIIFIVEFSYVVLEKDSHEYDDLGMYESLFGAHLACFPDEESPLEISEEKTDENRETSLGFEEKEIKPSPVSEPKKHPFPVMEEKRLENFLKILNHFEKLSKIEDKPIPLKKTSANNIKVKATFNYDVSSDVDLVQREPSNLETESFRTWDRSSNNSYSFGSVRKEREWKRTLACKLFEERHNVDVGEGMDSLWEAYEKGMSKPTVVVKETSARKKMNKKTSKVELKDFEEEDGDDGVHSCCLPPTGKMKLPNLGKISKAVKGLGWLHRVGKSKKVHNNNGDRY